MGRLGSLDCTQSISISATARDKPEGRKAPRDEKFDGRCRREGQRRDRKVGTTVAPFDNYTGGRYEK